MFPFFGNLYLDDPEPNSFLGHKLRCLNPYVRDLELRTKVSVKDWDCLLAFNEAARKKSAAWEAHGQTRDVRFLIPPDGPLSATLACRLHNPNFNVFDPYSPRGADASSLSINQIMSAGFTPDKVLIYDHTFRRDPVDPLIAYPPDILQIQERFTSELRNHMAAVVDVVWGAPVRERMKKTHRLEELELWGRYQGISPFLEWEKTGSSLRRFVIFVCHPEAMMYGEPKTLGRKQDLCLEVAARLAKISIRDKFYELDYDPKAHKFLSGENLARRAFLNEEGIAQLESVAYRKHSPDCIDRQKRNRTPLAERKLLCEYPGLYQYFDKANDGGLDQLNDEISAVRMGQSGTVTLAPNIYMDPEIDSEFVAPGWLKVLASALIGEGGVMLTAVEAMQFCSSVASGEFDQPGVSNLFDLPPAFKSWLQNQDGLKIDGKAIASERDLLQVHGILLRQPPAIAREKPCICITTIFVTVGSGQGEAFKDSV